jgi:glycerol-3-phosphate dehydrogenase
MRRTALAVTGRLSGRDLDGIAETAARALGWGTERLSGELDETRAELLVRHRLRMDVDVSR